MSSLVRKFVLAILVIAIIASSIGTVSADTYDRNGAVFYARNHATDYSGVPGSSYFWNHGGDCTNFISQSMYLGGNRPMTRNLNDGTSWFYFSSNAGQYSSSWAGVNAFKNYWTWRRANLIYIPAGQSYLPSSVPVQLGDVVQADWDGNGVYDHTMMITEIYWQGSNQYFKITAHQADRNNYPMQSQLQDNPSARFRVFLMPNTA